ncbi:MULTISPECIES: sensor histidine kinase [Pseudomonas]|uniref:histidine kinase n=2 Tax=Pseudomonas TaxID=286 RepID=A0AAX0VY71_9PSED|nr:MULTISPECIES: HAMP domain-containing sensor histidine kinase [Pseudomonas]MBH3360595.1 HAMP domain-containing histidine kinase [Pseudomonas guariconensis]MCO7623349.1 HAMP domain-containing histidine kinase [Pseudomonas guariconensis]MDM9594283.1 HAMP domain-containing sensor histidine kinase [Pseudomonas guariconensis]MDM9607113.1 HAMP domain-containing sensor histidine kinase [Pseudomonas guariconensis]MDM9612069.1 HAMP domain-containing sensor histidine kinase [Pseudomonas guariconensis]
MDLAPRSARLDVPVGGDSNVARKPFDLLRWYAWVSLAIIVSIAVGLGLISSRFIINESVERDALLSAQFIQAIADAEVRHVSIPNVRTMGELLDPRTDQAMPDVDPDARRRARGEFLDHIAHLPDMLLANIYAPDRTVIWSSNPALTGKSIESDEDLEQAFEYKMQVSASYHDFEDARSEQKFVTPPQQLFIENYIPLFDADGERVTAMVEIYKEPHDLIVRIEHGLLLIWLAIAIGASLVYFGLYGIMRRAARVMAVQQKRLISNETYVALGEMSSAVAHSLRNPLASIRSSAELAQAFDEGPAQKNISDIISQVDRMSQWVRQLLQSLRPLNDDAVPVDLSQVLQESLQAFAVPLARSGVNLDVKPLPSVQVVGHPVLLGQIFNSLIANALESMEKGGQLRVEVVRRDRRSLTLRLSDTGRGMSDQQQRMAFRPFFTTKQGGLGVGLVLVKRIMERFAGSVRLSSREGQGTSVSLNFRLVKS